MADKQIKVPGGKELIDSLFLLEKIGVSEKMIVADLGCGRRGYFTLQAAKLIGPDGLVYAIDVVKSALENVKSMANLFGIPNIKTIWANLEVAQSTKIPNDSIDLAMINNVLFQTKRDDLIIKEAVRILKKNGKLLITDWKKIKAPFGPPIQNRIGAEQVKIDTQKCGLTLKEEIKAGPYHYALVFIKI